MNKRRIKKYMSRSFSLLMIMILTTLNMSFATAKTTDEYLEDVKELVELIEANYVGDEVSEQQLFEAAMEGMVNELDSYSEFYNKEEAAEFLSSLAGSFVGIGVGLNYINDEIVITEVFEGGAAKEGGVIVNDIIVQVNDDVITPENIDSMVNRIIGDEGTYVRVTFKRGNETYELKLERRRIEIPTVIAVDISNYLDERDVNLLNEVAAYKVTSFSENTDETLIIEIRAAIAAGKDYLLLDMRGNGGGYINTALNMARELVPEGVICTIVEKSGEEYTYNSNLKDPKMEVVMLLDGNSASATELFAAAVKDAGVGVIIGEQSYGKGVGQTIFDVNDDYKVKLTIFEYFSRNGYKINGIGVAPTIEVDMPEYIYSEDRFYTTDVDPQIKNVEGILSFLGYFNEEPNETYTYETYLAVKKFQADTGLYSYGVCDFGTQSMLNNQYTAAKLIKDIQLEEALNWIEDDILKQ